MKSPSEATVWALWQPGVPHGDSLGFGPETPAHVQTLAFSTLQWK